MDEGYSCDHAWVVDRVDRTGEEQDQQGRRVARITSTYWRCRRCGATKGGDNDPRNLGPFMHPPLSVTSFEPSFPPIDRHGRMTRAADGRSLVTKGTFCDDLSALSRRSSVINATG